MSTRLQRGHPPSKLKEKLLHLMAH